MQTLADLPAIALAPASVARGLPPGLSAVDISEPPDRLESCIVWRSDDDAPVTTAFRVAATSLFNSARA
jgi:hypothetical protein